MITNAKIQTPIGAGICQGKFSAGDGNDMLAEPRVLVRLPVNETTRAALWNRNCLTPHANKSGLWVFRASECGCGWAEILLLLALVAAAILLLGRCGVPW
jgi:hypothetical protein